MIPVDYVIRCYAGWLGKTIGVRFGTPIEGWGYRKIQEEFGEVTGYVADYNDYASDDDTNGPLFFLRALEDTDPSGPLTEKAAGDTWLNYIPYEHGMLWWGGYGNSTEHTAYLNLRAGIPSPDSGSLQQNGPAVAQQIGGQIFSDCWGLIFPCNPTKAADYAETMSHVSHDGDGVYGGRFVAAAIAQAFESSDIQSVLTRALREVPENSEFMRMAKDILDYHKNHADEDWRPAMEYIIDNWGYDRYPGNCHVIPNSAVMLMSMLYGNGDFSRTLCICNMCGWDTDCNCGNVGTILGVLNGLEGISASWRDPIHDFMVSSSVVGHMNITTLPEYTRRLCAVAYAQAGEKIPEEWREFVSGAHTVDPILPGSTCSLRGTGGCRICHSESEPAVEVKLHNIAADKAEYVWYGTYYHPSDFTDSRYDPAFSPVLYPGQSVRIRVKALDRSIRARVFCTEEQTGQEYKGKGLTLTPGVWTELTLLIPPMEGGRIGRTGLKIRGDGDASLLIAWMDFEGSAEYTLDFAKETEEKWPRTLHREVTQMTRLKGLWEIWDHKLCGSCADYGAAFTGNTAWKDMEITCRWKPEGKFGRTGFGFRIQGAIRGYAVLAGCDILYLCRNDNGYTTLAQTARPEGDTLELTVRCKGDRIEVIEGERVLMEARDTAWDHGMTGLLLEEGGRASFEWMKIRELE